MKLRLQLNIGTEDAKRLGLDKEKETKDGSVIDCPDSRVLDKMRLSAYLLQRGWAVPAEVADRTERPAVERPAAERPAARSGGKAGSDVG